MGEKDRRAAEQAVLLVSRLNLRLSESARSGVKDPDLVATLPMAVLFSIDTDGPMRPTSIQELTGLSSGGVTKLVERLEAKGMVTRKTGVIAEDRRGVLVELTRRGRTTVRSLADGIAASSRDVASLVRDIAEVLEP